MGTSNIKPVAGRTVFITAPGATVDGTQNSDTITFHRGASGFAVNDVVCRATDSTDTTAVSSVTSDTVIVFDKALNLTDGERIINLKLDTLPGGLINRDGYLGSEFIFLDPAGTKAATLANGTPGSNQIKTDADGEGEFYATPGRLLDYTVLDSNSEFSADSQTIADIAVSGEADIAVPVTTGTSQQINIQAAIDAVSGAGGGIVRLGTGTYTIDVGIAVKSNVWLRGVGMNATIIKVTAETVVNAITQESTSLVSFVRVSDLTVDGNDASQSSGNGSGILILNTDNIVIENVEVKDCRASGIAIEAIDVSMENIVVRGCHIHDVVSGTSLAFHAGIWMENGGSFTINDVLITGNLLEDIGDGNTNTVGNGMNLAHVGISTIVSENILRDIRLNGIRVSDNGKINIVDNHMTNVGLSDVVNGGNGIFITGVGDVLVANNTIDTVAVNSDNGIELSLGAANGNAVVSGNRITNVKNVVKNAIFAGNNSDTSIVGNVCHDNLGRGISLVTSDGVSSNNKTVTGNIVEDCGGIGIRSWGATNVSIANNIVRSPGAVGIDVTEGQTVSGAEPHEISVIGNVVTDTAAGSGINIAGEFTAPTGNLARRVVVANNVVRNSNDRGLRIVGVEAISITGNVLEGNKESGMLISTVDDCVISSNLIKNNGAAGGGSSDDDGIKITGINDSIFIDGNAFIDNASAGAFAISDSGSTTTNLVVGDNFMRGNGSAGISFTSIATSYDVASPAGGTLTLPTTGNYFSITGTNAITEVTGTYPGHVVVLKFTGVLTFTNDNSNLNLSAGGNFVTAADSTITLVTDGTNWWEMSRSSN